MPDKSGNDLNDQKEVTQFLNSQISYLGGLKSLDFWRKIALESIPVYLFIAIEGLYTSFNAQAETGNTLLSLLFIISFSAIGLSIFRMHSQLRLYQLNEQLRIIELAQSKLKETDGEVK